MRKFGGDGEPRKGTGGAKSEEKFCRERTHRAQKGKRTLYREKMPGTGILQVGTEITEWDGKMDWPRKSAEVAKGGENLVVSGRI